MQELILDLLSRVCGSQAGAARGGPQRFGRLLGRLTELRTLRHNYLLLTRQQPGLWRRGCTRNLKNDHYHLWGVSGIKWSHMSWETLEKRFGNAKVFTWFWSDCDGFFGSLLVFFLSWLRFIQSCSHWVIASNGTEACLWTAVVYLDKRYFIGLFITVVYSYHVNLQYFLLCWILLQ